MYSEQPSRNLAMELVRVTEAAALSAARFMGRDDKEAADQAAVDGMRLILNTIGFSVVEGSSPGFLVNGGHQDYSIPL